ncbi:Putative phage tail protein [Gemmobacter megaterium]|uniref:Putative phage tail protein n=1 Tax=Gemmobacter megaterium TaxID=1086013 RepID=A0A1N7LQ49_9RHOB|nr:glycoside hydrolase/phage tail family protein [Gemmobacter megaterium]GGE11176.1 phage host specificity protein [Gemmobacter megaterium]SIS75967.1 Putative phage tail protein [Gemmobacter megaterium]
MATLLLSAAGAAIGSGVGGTVLGLSGAVIGRAVGATLGRVIDERLLGRGSAPVEVGRVDRFRVMGAGEGQAVAQVWGRVRLGGQVIWASRFQEDVTRTRGGKGMSRPVSLEYSYSVSLAVALCEGVILRVGRIWADGQEVDPDSLDLRIYTGTETQLPDPRIEAVEGAGLAPAYRGIAYVVIEDLDLGRFGNRVPQFSFEVIRAAAEADGLADAVQAVAMIPGTGEYALATTPVHLAYGPGQAATANVHGIGRRTDFSLALDQLAGEAPGCGAVSLIVSWFGNDLRCGSCQVQPKVEQTSFDGVGQPWRAGGIGRAQAQAVPQDGDGRPVYGGSPGDASVLEAIAALKDAGQAVMFYPFVLMEQMAGNGLADPWSGAPDQPALPWRGRITLSVAPGRGNSPDRSAAADAEVAAFFGAVQPGDFLRAQGQVVYTGPAGDWGYRRFILHYAHLCALAGGVDAFCVGSEMRGLTQIRGAGDSFPAVAALRHLVAEVRDILGPDCKISYAADWSEYWGYQSPEGNRYFHLDPLWADPQVDFVGIDNYMPLSDWRDGEDHADAGWGAIYDLDYLKANVAGGEGYHWYYASPQGEAAQIRTPITDVAHGEDWIWRYKDLRGWWENAHHARIDGVRQAEPSMWVPGSKPFWFTEMGCAAIDKGTNQPNLFLDPKSSESTLPKYSTGRRDDLIQMQYLRAMAGYWREAGNNPLSPLYGGRMVDMSRAFVWAWDARPFPQFPGRTEIWADGGNYSRGHWISGRSASQPLAAVVAEICARAGVGAVDVSGLYGVVRGYQQGDGGTARAALQPLMLAYGFEVVERDGVLRFRMRDGRLTARVAPEDLAVQRDAEGVLELTRAAGASVAGRVRVGFVEAEADFAAGTEEAAFPDEVNLGAALSELPLLLTRAEGRALAQRWLAEARVARDGARLALPPSQARLGAGDVLDLGAAGLYRIDRAESAGLRVIEAVRVEPAVYVASDEAEARAVPRAFVPPVPVFPVFLDLPLLTGTEDPLAPHLAVAALPWPGAVAVWDSDLDAGYEVNRLVSAPSAIGVTQTPLRRARAGLWDRGEALRVRMIRGQLSSASMAQVLNGANAVAIGDGSAEGWEVLQYVEAAAVAPGEWDLSLRLRGQAGTDAVMPEEWPAGSVLVVLDRTVGQVSLAPSKRGLTRQYRIGVAARGYDDPAVVHRAEAFAGNGLRPLAPVHLRHDRPGGDDRFTWVRRTRIDGDTWLSEDVPLGEATESYRVRVRQGAIIKREVTVTQPEWVYSTAERIADDVLGPWRLEVAQVSDRVGAGLWRGMDLPD